MSSADFGDYVPTFEPGEDFFRDLFALADKVGGTVGIAKVGLVITLPAGSDRADLVASRITNDDFGHAYIVAGTDSHLVIDL